MKKLIIAIFIILMVYPLAATGPGDMIILVHPFSNTGDQKYAWLSAGMADSVVNDLMILKNVRVISERDRKKSIEEIEFGMSGLVEDQKAVKAGGVLGANVIFTGSYTVVNNAVRVIAKLINVKTGELVKSAKLDGTLEGIFDLQDKIVMTLLSEVQKADIKDVRPPVITDTEKKAISDAPRTSFSAYEWYSRGLQVQNTNPKLALENFDKAIALDPGYGDALQQAGYLAGSNFSEFDRALGYLNRAEGIFKKHPGVNTGKYADVMINTGTVYWGKGELDRALNYYFRSRDIYTSINQKNSLGYASAVWGIGLIYYGKQQHAEALRFYSESKSVYDTLNMQNTSMYADLMTNFGSVFHGMRRHDESLDYYNRSKSILDGLQLQNTMAYANALWGIGLIFFERQDYSRALQYYLDSERAFAALRMSETSNYAMIILNIGMIYERQNRLDEALSYFMRCKTIMDRLNLRNTLNYGNLLINIGLVYQKRNSLDESLEYLFSSKTLLERLGLQNSQNYASALYNIAYVYDRQGRNRDAAGFYRNAAAVYSRLGVNEWAQRALDRATALGY